MPGTRRDAYASLRSAAPARIDARRVQPPRGRESLDPVHAVTQGTELDLSPLPTPVRAEGSIDMRYLKDCARRVSREDTNTNGPNSGPRRRVDERTSSARHQRGDQPMAQPMQLRHRTVDHDRDCERRDHERARDRGQGLGPTAEHHLEDDRVGKDRDPDHERQLVPAGQLHVSSRDVGGAVAPETGARPCQRTTLVEIARAPPPCADVIPTFERELRGSRRCSRP